VNIERDQRERVGRLKRRGVAFAFAPFSLMYGIRLRRGRPEKSMARAFCAFIGVPQLRDADS
jgi:hypothetical protein